MILRNVSYFHQVSAMRERILFVDDEPMVLKGLERGLRAMRNEWDM